jgi:adenylate cyclase
MEKIKGDHDREAEITNAWHTYLTTGLLPKGMHLAWFETPFFRRMARLLPKDPRCRLCSYPFEGIGGQLVKFLLGVKRSRLNPQLCNFCERFARKLPGGTELDASLLFADVRGSTGLAEGMRAREFSRLIDRFYRASVRVLFQHGGLVEKLIGDEVTAFFVPAFAGKAYARAAVAAGRDILRATGHQDKVGPWIPVGIGVHTGPAYIGTVGEHGEVEDIAVLGDNVNIASRLAGLAGAGELLISEQTRLRAELDSAGMEPRRLSLRGKEQPIDAWAITPHTRF